MAGTSRLLGLFCALSSAVNAARGPGEFHYGAAFGSPFNVATDCNDINLISPELLMNWGPDNRNDATINVCGNSNIKFLPTLWGRDFDVPELSALPNSPKPFGVFLENEPNWFGAYSTDHGVGCNLTAKQCATRYYTETNIINQKFGVGAVKLFTPSPVNPTYPKCTGPGQYGCTYEDQISWFKDYFVACPNCLHDAWAINHHEYSCNLATTQANIQRLWTNFGKKNVFVGELGCDGPSPATQAQYLRDFVAWAYTQQYVVGFIWAGLNNVGSSGAQLVLNGQLTAVGTAYKQIQQQYPPKLTA
ncbi:glycosyl hydrolase catalytic core-domain-containing protein [Xylaria castorea]|nr:glycosyl hydrolase catalytic core-domain-containing protein [Xylaria castorea]